MTHFLTSTLKTHAFYLLYLYLQGFFLFAIENCVLFFHWDYRKILDLAFFELVVVELSCSKADHPIFLATQIC